MMADVFGAEVLVPHVYEGSAFGAAALGMYAMQTISQLEDIEKLIQIDDRHIPDLQVFDTYQQLFSVYQRLYAGLVGEFTTLSAFQRSDF